MAYVKLTKAQFVKHDFKYIKELADLCLNDSAKIQFVEDDNIVEYNCRIAPEHREKFKNYLASSNYESFSEYLVSEKLLECKIENITTHKKITDILKRQFTNNGAVLTDLYEQGVVNYYLSDRINVNLPNGLHIKYEKYFQSVSILLDNLYDNKWFSIGYRRDCDELKNIFSHVKQLTKVSRIDNYYPADLLLFKNEESLIEFEKRIRANQNEIDLKNTFDFHFDNKSCIGVSLKYSPDVTYKIVNETHYIIDKYSNKSLSDMQIVRSNLRTEFIFKDFMINVKRDNISGTYIPPMSWYDKSNKYAAAGKIPKEIIKNYVINQDEFDEIKSELPKDLILAEKSLKLNQIAIDFITNKMKLSYLMLKLNLADYRDNRKDGCENYKYNIPARFNFVKFINDSYLASHKIGPNNPKFLYIG